MENGDELAIGGDRFLPGDAGTVELPVGHLINYQPVSMTVHVLRGVKPGPTLLISAALHGDEMNGVESIRRVLKSRSLRSLRGTLIAAPVVNMPAYLTRSRYLPDRRDLNRIFPGSAQGSLGARLADLFINQVVSHCTHAIDMHTGAVNRSNLSHVRISPGDEEGLAMARSFQTPVILESQVPRGSLREHFTREGIPNVLFEGGEAHRLEPAVVRYGTQGIISVMRLLKMLPPSRKKQEHHSKTTVFSRYTSWVRAPRGGIFLPSEKMGRAVGPDTELGVISDPLGAHETKILAHAEGVIIGRCHDATVNEGDALFNIALTKDPAEAEKKIILHEELLEEMVQPFQD